MNYHFICRKITISIAIGSLFILSSLIIAHADVVNSGFEQGSTGWTLSVHPFYYDNNQYNVTMRVDTANPHSGARELYLSEYKHTGMWGESIGASQSVNLTGVNYTTMYVTGYSKYNVSSWIMYVDNTVVGLGSLNSTYSFVASNKLSYTGMHNIYVNLYGQSTSLGDEYCYAYIDDISFIQYLPPTASFTYAGTSIDTPLTVRFTDTSIRDPISWSWDFGDGTPINTTQNPVHTFCNSGNYTVTLTVTNPEGSSTCYIYVTVPTSNLVNGGFEQGSTGWTLSVHPFYYDNNQYNVTMRVDTANPHSGARELYLSECKRAGQWGESIGASQSVNLTGVNYITMYVAGYSKYNVSSWIMYVDNTVIGGGNLNSTYSFVASNRLNYIGMHTIYINLYGESIPQGDEYCYAYIDDVSFTQNLSPDASFASNLTSGITSLTVQFNDTSTGCPTNWSWDFGDGTNSTKQNPVHTFNRSGIYNVSLTVTNPVGSDTCYKNLMIGNKVDLWITSMDIIFKKRML